MFSTLIDPTSLAPHLADETGSSSTAASISASPPKASSCISTRTFPARAMRTSIAICRARRPAPTDVIRCRPPSRCAERFGALGIGPGTQVVAYDADSGMYAARLWWMLRFMGHDAVAVLDGGLARWIREGHAVRGGREVVRAAYVRRRAARGVAARCRRGARRTLDDPDAAARRRTRRAALSRRERAARQAGRPHSRRQQLLLPAEPDRRQDVQSAPTSFARPGSRSSATGRRIRWSCTAAPASRPATTCWRWSTRA